MNNHTPGPWRVEAFTVNGNMRGVGTSTHTVAAAYSDQDARLIAASPQMLAALQSICGLADSPDASKGAMDRALTDIYDLARAAIAKATNG